MFNCAWLLLLQPLLYNHLMDSCSYVHKNTLLAAKGGCKCTPLTPSKSATVLKMGIIWDESFMYLNRDTNRYIP